MSLVVTLEPGMPGYEKHKLDYMCTNYHGGEYGYRRIHVTDMEFARYLYEQTGVHIDLGSQRQSCKGQSGAISSSYNIVGEDGEPTGEELHLTASLSRYRKYALYVDRDPFDPFHSILLIKPRRQNAKKQSGQT